jgi:charged multivesicular body protein 2A
MMQAMKGATMALGSMNKQMNLPSLQRIAMEFERENDIMDQRQEMMDDVMDDVMEGGVEEEGDEVVEQVLEEIGVDFNQAVSLFYARWPPLKAGKPEQLETNVHFPAQLGETPTALGSTAQAEGRIAQAVGGDGGSGGGGGADPIDDDLAARFDNLKK